MYIIFKTKILNYYTLVINTYLTYFNNNLKAMFTF